MSLRFLRGHLSKKQTVIRLHQHFTTKGLEGLIVGGVSLTHRPRPNFGPQLEFGDDCKSIRPRCPTCTELDSLAFAGMDAIVNIDRDRRETMVQHLRRRVQHCGWQAARADKLAFNWHREGNNAYLMMHHFNMAHIEADRRRQLQPPISKPTPRVKGPSEITERLTYRRGRDSDNPEVYQTTTPEVQSASTPAVTVTRITQVEQHVPLAEAATPRAYRVGS